MKRIAFVAMATFTAITATAYAAAPAAVAQAVQDCCALVLSCCGLGGCC